jgi:hypothetical protein
MEFLLLLPTKIPEAGSACSGGQGFLGPGVTDPSVTVKCEPQAAHGLPTPRRAFEKSVWFPTSTSLVRPTRLAGLPKLVW